jgi:hypothetical protein
VALLNNDISIGNKLSLRAWRLLHAVVALAVLAAISTRTAAQDNTPPVKSERNADSTSTDKTATAAKGEIPQSWARA